jgi:hypothetical protein
VIDYSTVLSRGAVAMQEPAIRRMGAPSHARIEEGIRRLAAAVGEERSAKNPA